MSEGSYICGDVKIHSLVPCGILANRKSAGSVGGRYLQCGFLRAFCHRGIVMENTSQNRDIGDVGIILSLGGAVLAFRHRNTFWQVNVLVNNRVTNSRVSVSFSLRMQSILHTIKIVA